MRITSILLAVILFSACTLLPQPGEAPKRYSLPEISLSSSQQQKPYVLAVATPTVHVPLDTTRIMVRPKNDQIDYFADVEWAGRFDHLFQDAVIYALQNTGCYQTVSRSAEGIFFTHQLQLSIRRFDIEIKDGKSYGVIDIWAELIKWPERTVISTKALQKRQKIGSPPGVENSLEGLKTAYVHIFHDLLNWLKEHP